MTDATPILHYGKGQGAARVDVDALIRGRGLIQANSGGGKSWALRQLLEETFAPEGAHSEAAEAVVTLAAQGRKRGYALVCATQRLSKLSKDVAAELNTKLIGRTGLDLDVKRAGDELGMDKERRQSLATLEPG